MNHVDIEELLTPYEGPNDAHRAFRQEFRYLNAFYYLIVSGKDLLRQHLRDNIADAQAAARARNPDGKYAIGVVTRSISASQFQGVHVPSVDAESLLANFDGFIDLVAKHCVVGAHRAILDFAGNLLLELDQRSLLSLQSAMRLRLLQRRLRPPEIATIFENLGEPIATDLSQDLRLRILGELRNLLEHNDSRATPEYVRLLAPSTLSVGHPVLVTSKEVGEAFALIEFTAASLNRRILSRFPLENLQA